MHWLVSVPQTHISQMLVFNIGAWFLFSHCTVLHDLHLWVQVLRAIQTYLKMCLLQIPTIVLKKAHRAVHYIHHHFSCMQQHSQQCFMKICNCSRIFCLFVCLFVCWNTLNNATGRYVVVAGSFCRVNFWFDFNHSNWVVLIVNIYFYLQTIRNFWTSFRMLVEAVNTLLYFNWHWYD